MKKQATKHTTATEARRSMAETGRKTTPLQAQVLLAALTTVRITRADLFHPTTTNRKECNP